MGGSLELVDGELPGACFRLTLPLLREKAAIAQREPPASGALGD